MWWSQEPCLCFDEGCNIIFNFWLFFFSIFFSLSVSFLFLFSYVAYNIVNVEAGDEAVLTCASTSKMYLVMVTWEIKSNTSCSLAYRNDRNETKLNCSERMMWKYSPDRDPALRIYPVNLSDEGNYTCEIATDMGNFHFSSSLSVIGKTHLVFFCSCWMEIKMAWFGVKRPNSFWMYAEIENNVET